MGQLLNMSMCAEEKGQVSVISARRKASAAAGLQGSGWQLRVAAVSASFL